MYLDTKTFSSFLEWTGREGGRKGSKFSYKRPPDIEKVLLLFFFSDNFFVFLSKCFLQDSMKDSGILILFYKTY